MRTDLYRKAMRRWQMTATRANKKAVGRTKKADIKRHFNGVPLYLCPLRRNKPVKRVLRKGAGSRNARSHNSHDEQAGIEVASPLGEKRPQVGRAPVRLETIRLPARYRAFALLVNYDVLRKE